VQRILAKQFVITFVTIISLFICYHSIVWFVFTSKIFDQSPKYIGDLGRMSYQIDSLVPRVPSSNLPLRHFERLSANHQVMELVTIGDSFSNGMGSGKNAYYQDYLASRFRINVLNIQNIDETYGYIDTIRYLNRIGWFKRHQTKAVLIQCVVRESLNHVPSKNSLLASPKNLNSVLFNKKFTTEFPSHYWINTGNYKFPYYSIAYKFKTNAKKEVYRFALTREMFTSKASSHLLVYRDDINNIKQFNEKSIQILNDELNTLSNELSKTGMTLIFMPSVDKYDLYYNYIANNHNFPENPFFGLLRKQTKKYQLIDTKAILTPLLARKDLDVYYADDTHWSFKASDAISKDSSFDILNKGKI
jgi:hypothetical protein